MKTYSYIRVSTSEQAIHGNSLDMQRDKINAYCVSKGLPKPNIFSDKGLSGTNNKNRPALQELLSIIKNGDHIIFYSFDRFARNTRQALEMIDALTKRGVTFHSLSQQIDTTTPMGQFAITIMAACAQLESQTTGQRVKDNLQNRKAQNLTYCNKITGFDKVFDTLPDGRRTNGRLVPNEQLKIVQLIKYLKAQNKSAFTIAEELNMDEFKTITGRPFHPNSVTAILNNPIYNNVEPSNELLLPKEEPQEAISAD